MSKHSLLLARAVVETLESRRLLSTTLLDFASAGGGVDGTGFTGVLPTSHGAGLVTSKLALNSGSLLVSTTAGDFVATNNAQDNALDLGLDATQAFTVQTRITGFPFNHNWQAGGIFVGTNEDNYVKLVVGFNSQSIVQLATESAAAFKNVNTLGVSFSGLSTIDLRLVGNPSTKTITAYYRLNSSNDADWRSAGSVSNTAIFTTTSKAGIVTTNNGSSTSVTVPFDYFSLTGGTTTTTVSNFSVGSAINISKLTGNQTEQKIAINPTNPNNIVAVSMNGNNNQSQLLVSRSTDGGATWSTSYIGGAQDGLSSSTNRVDPALAFDSFGNLYVSYLVASNSSTIRVEVERSSNGGVSFSPMVAVGNDGLGPDSPKIATGPDAVNPSLQDVWISYTDTNANRIKVVHASASGLGAVGSFSGSTTVSSTGGSFSNLAVGPNGQVAVTWQNPAGGVGPSTIYVATDSDGAGSAASFVTRAATSTNVGGFDPIPAQPTRTIDTENQVAFDRSGDSTNGRLYLLYTDAAAVGSADTNIMLRYSDSLGSSWSSAVRVNDDSTNKSQFLPALAVDQTTGNVGVSWFDARNSPNNNTSQRYAAVSTNHGVSFLANILVSPGVSNQANANGFADGDVDYGDYSGLAFQSGKLVPSWADNSNSTGDNPNGATAFDIYTAVIVVNV